MYDVLRAAPSAGPWPDPRFGASKVDLVSEPPATQPVGEVAETGSQEQAASLAATDDALRLEQIDVELTGVEAALRRLDDGSFGTCEVCAAPLDAAVLAAAPLTTRCSQPHR
jgi:DnaK suppressor protein